MDFFECVAARRARDARESEIKEIAKQMPFAKKVAGIALII